MFRPDPKSEPRPKKRIKALKRTPLKKKPYTLKRSAIKKKPRKVTGELELFRIIYFERKGICQVTGKKINFSVNSFMHILGKGTRPDLRLKKDNILHVISDFHYNYDNNSKAKTLERYPAAEWIYELKDQLKEKYRAAATGNKAI